MKIVIDIPEEFENHFGWDRFHDSFNRIYYDIEHDIRRGIDHTLSGNYELETITMLNESFNNAEVQKVGRWICLRDQYDDVINAVCSECDAHGYDKWKFCPECGARMDGDE